MGSITFYILISFQIQISTTESFYGTTMRSSLSRLYRHYDLILCTGNNTLVSDYRRREFKFQQALLLPTQLPEFVNIFSKERLRYGRTVLYLKPHDLDELRDFITQIGALFKQDPTTLYFDSRIRTFIRWPTGDLVPDRRNKILHQFAKFFPLNSEVFVTFQTTSDILEIYSIGNITFVKPLQTFCLRKRKPCILQFVPLSIRRRNLEGALIKATSFIDMYLEKVKESIGLKQALAQVSTSYLRGNGTLEFSGGIGVNILWALRDMLNFSIKALEADNYILEGSNGTLTGIGAQLQNGEADISIADSYILPFRLKYLTVLFPIIDDEILAHFRQPKASTVRNIYSSAFTRNAWLAFGSTVLLLMASSFFFVWAGCRMHKDPEWESEESGLWIISVICQNDWYYRPRTFSGKIVMLSTLFLSMISFAAYSGAIISALALEPFPIKSAKDLKDYGFEFIFNPNVYYSFFDTGPTSSGRSWHSEILKSHEQPYKGDKDAFERMLNGDRNVFLTTADVFETVYKLLKYEDSFICETVDGIQFSTRTLQSAFFLSKGTPFKEIFNQKLLYIMEVGLLNRYRNIPDEQAVCAFSCTLFRAHLGFEDVLTPFLILTIGHVSSLLAFGVEKLIYRSRNAEYRRYLADYFIYS